MRVNTRPVAAGSQRAQTPASRSTLAAVWGWAQQRTAAAGSRPPLLPTSRTHGAALRASTAVRAHTTRLARVALYATYWGSAACAPPQYVADQHAALQSPVTLGDGKTGKPSLDQLAAESGPAAAPPVHPPSPAVHPPSSGASTQQPVAAASPVAATSPGDAPAGDALAGGGSNPAVEPATQPESAPFDPRATPDPAPAATSIYYELTLRYCEGGVHLLGARRMRLARPSTLPRMLGRFAAELWIGHELLERNRFDFPLVAADVVEPGAERREPPAMQLGPSTDVVWKVKVADRVRATQAWVIDRATGERWLLDWPPSASLPKPTADAPCPSFGGK